MPFFSCYLVTLRRSKVRAELRRARRPRSLGGPSRPDSGGPMALKKLPGDRLAKRRREMKAKRTKDEVRREIPYSRPRPTTSVFRSGLLRICRRKGHPTVDPKVNDTMGNQIGPFAVHETCFCNLNIHFTNRQYFPFPACRGKGPQWTQK